jgi:L-malate glycosyltransferase
MKILFLTPWYPYPDEKSVNHGIFIQDQAVAVGKQHEVVVVASEVDYNNFSISNHSIQRSVFKNVTEYRITIKRSLPFYNQLNYFIITLRHILRIAKEFNPDLIHGNIGYPGAFFSFITGIVISKPFVVTEHYSQFKANFRSLWHKWITIFSMRKANALIAVSQHTAQEIFKYVRRKPAVIGNIIHFEKFDFNNSRKRKQIDVYNIGFLGVLENDKKGLDILLKAMVGIEHKCVLHIAGGGSLLQSYKTMAKDLGIFDQCKFYGFMTYWQVPEFMKQLDFFVSASRFESFGMAIVEAMALGLPVVVTDSGGPKDFVNEYNGIIVEKNSPSALNVGIVSMMDNYEKYDPILIRDYANKNFSEEVFLMKMNMLYKSFLNDKK